MLKKSVISLIAYDAHYLPASIRSYYPYVDEIVLGLDENRISWSGNSFKFDENKLWTELKKIDVENKITIIEDNFHKSQVPLENDNYERNFLKSHCTHDWIFSFDADEELINAKEFFYDFSPHFEPYYKKLDGSFTWFLPYKEFENDYLVIADEAGRIFKGDVQGFCTQKENTFTYCRWSSNQRHVLTNLGIIHWSFCRPEGEVNQKIHNFGHSDKTNADPFFEIWKQINLENFHELNNFKTSGFGQNQWSKLIKISKKDFRQIMKQEADRLI